MLRILNKQHGFTLIEITIVIVITGILTFVTASIITQQSETFTKIFNRAGLMFEGRKAMNKIRLDFQNLAPDSVSTMQANLFEFTDTADNNISYRIVGNNLDRSGETIAKYLQSLLFTYYDSDMTVTGVTTNLFIMKVNLDFEQNGETLQLEEFIYARN